MLEYLKKKTICNYINLFAAVFAIVMTIVYCVYANTYALFNVGVLLCLLGAIVLDIVLFVIETPVDEYLKIVAALLTALVAAIFFVDFAGDVVDYFNGVEFLGRGAKVGHIVTITVFLFILMAIQVATAFFAKKANK